MEGGEKRSGGVEEREKGHREEMDGMGGRAWVASSLNFLLPLSTHPCAPLPNVKYSEARQWSDVACMLKYMWVQKLCVIDRVNMCACMGVGLGEGTCVTIAGASSDEQ